MSFDVVQTNGYATFQDIGRPHAAALGLSPSGAMDMTALRLGNWLLGNALNAVSIEVLMGGLQLAVTSPVSIVLTGLGLKASRNHQPLPNFQVTRLNTGDVLRFQTPSKGVRGYLCVARGFEAPRFQDSASVSRREGIGAPLQAGQHLPTNPMLASQGPYIPQSLVQIDTPLTLRLLPTYQWCEFSARSKNTLLEKEFTLSPNCDRTGFQLSGDKIDVPYTTMSSEAMLPGAVQITPSGTPIVMMRNGPTIGGYPKIGTLFSMDLSKLTQLRPGQTVQFKPMSLEHARQKLEQFEKFLK